MEEVNERKKQEKIVSKLISHSIGYKNDHCLSMEGASSELLPMGTEQSQER